MTSRARQDGHPDGHSKDNSGSKAHTWPLYSIYIFTLQSLSPRYFILLDMYHVIILRLNSVLMTEISTSCYFCSFNPSPQCTCKSSAQSSSSMSRHVVLWCFCSVVCLLVFAFIAFILVSNPKNHCQYQRQGAQPLCFLSGVL